MDTQKKDIYSNIDRWNKWKKETKKINGISKDNSDLILKFLNDMEQGMNVSPRTIKGPRSPTTLINLRDHVVFFAKKIRKPIRKYSKADLHLLDNGIREGKVKRKDGKPFRAFGNYIKDFKSFWGWLLRTGEVNENITSDLSKKVDKKPAWVYLNETEFKKMANSSNSDYRALIFFMLDTGLRVTEAYSIKVKDFNRDFTKLAIPDEVAKTFGRTINLKLCSELIKEYIQLNELKYNDYLIIKKPPAFNKYLREHCKRLFGNGETKSRGRYDQFSIYSIRHNSSCYWLKRYPNLRGLMYRMGWKREEQANYYHEFLGIRDEITDDDMVTREDKTKMEKEIEELKDKMKRFALMMKNEVDEQKIFISKSLDEEKRSREDLKLKDGEEIKVMK